MAENNTNRTRRTVRFPNTLPRRNRLTREEENYLRFIQAEYNDLPSQEAFVNSLNDINNAGKARMRNALMVNANRTRNLRASRQSIVTSATPQNMNLIRTMRALRRHNHAGIYRNLNALTPHLGQNRANAMRRRLTESLYRVRLNRAESHALGRLLTEYNDPLAAMRHVRNLNASNTSKQRIINQIMYLYGDGMNTNRLHQMQEIRNSVIRANLNGEQAVQLENVLGASGAFDA